MLEFAYTGEVNVAQELLPSLLHTARSFRIKGLDKVENPLEPPLRVCLLYFFFCKLGIDSSGNAVEG